MAFAARARFERGEDGAGGRASRPSPGTPLFAEIVDRQFDSFGPLFSVPLRFWRGGARERAAAGPRDGPRGVARDPGGDRRRDAGDGRARPRGRAGTRCAPDSGTRSSAYRYDASPDRVAIGIYDPNHPGDDDVEAAARAGARTASIALSPIDGRAAASGSWRCPYAAGQPPG